MASTTPSKTRRERTEKFPLEPWEVGGELLDILSRGLYADAKAAVREYVQNGVDAAATAITISVNGPVVSVRDNGKGMNWDTLRKARRFGMSDKSPLSTVGYRGIGIYSSFGMCERLVISTRRAGTAELLNLTFQFGPMRRILEQDKSSSKRTPVALGDLLYEYTEFDREPYSGDRSDSFTLVRLEGIAPEYRSQLADTKAMRSYLLNTIPVAFPRVGYGAQVNRWLKQHAQLNPVRVTLRMEDERDIKVAPIVSDAVGDPEFAWVTDAEQKRLAFVWYALSNSGEQIPSENGRDEAAGVSGLLLKMKGFTLGDRLTLKPLWPPKGGRTLYHHYTGEIHVLDMAKVFPNAARDDLEPSPYKQVLVRYLTDAFGKLSSAADRTRQLHSITRRLDHLSESLADLGKRRGSPVTDQLELYRESKNLVADFEKTERDLERLSKPTKAEAPTAQQKQEIGALTKKLGKSLRDATEVVEATARQTARPSATTPVGQRTLRPHVVLIDRALSAVRAMNKSKRAKATSTALRELEGAKRAELLHRAVAALDGLKASGVTLNSAAETARKELRTLLGWSPIGPVSLKEALEEEGVLAATEREETLIGSIDEGLLSAAGGRGQLYEALLRAIAESAGRNDDLS